MPLQRAITDFGADQAFGLVPKKFQEHYGMAIPVSTVRNITEYHAHQMHEQREMARYQQHRAAGNKWPK
ncbi:MAG: hypothetical protein Q7U57_03245 [Methylovulum sp.]|nr:hypothetical protein [Methylovulum sp.]